MSKMIGTKSLQARYTTSGASLTTLQFNYRGQWIDVAQNCEHTENRGKRAMKIMSPYTARTKLGKFIWPLGQAQKVFDLQAHWHPHAIHGFHSQVEFEALQPSAESVTMYFDSRNKKHEFAFPSEFEFETQYLIRESTLAVKHVLRNVGDAPMPSGGGSHPFFAKYPLASVSGPKIQFNAHSYWDVDSQYPTESMPSGTMSKVSGADGFSVERIPEDRYDQCFVGWDGIFTALWEELGLKLTLVDKSAEPTSYLHLWYDSGRGTFAPEPVWTPGDAFNLAANGIECGMKVLMPGESREFVHEYTFSLA